MMSGPLPVARRTLSVWSYWSKGGRESLISVPGWEAWKASAISLKKSMLSGPQL
jgi:hypothetical protein